MLHKYAHFCGSDAQLRLHGRIQFFASKLWIPAAVGTYCVMLSATTAYAYHALQIEGVSPVYVAVAWVNVFNSFVWGVSVQF